MVTNDTVVTGDKFLTGEKCSLHPSTCALAVFDFAVNFLTQMVYT